MDRQVLSRNVDCRNVRNSRRSFFAKLTAAAATTCLTPQQGRAGRPVESEAKSLPPIAVFIKHIQALGIEEIARRIGTQPVTGIEATLRKGGLIEPARLDAELPRLCEALARHDRRVLIAASDINRADRNAEKYLRQLAACHVPYFRMAYYRYDIDKPILPQLDRFARQAMQLAQLAASEGLTALYQNHAGAHYVGAAVWDLLHVLKDIAPDHLTVALDIRHAGVELSQSYPSACAAIEPHRRAVYVKDFRWKDSKPENVPLGQGYVRPVFDLVARYGFVGPVSLHMEYTDHRDPTQVEESWRSICNDITTLRQWLQEAIVPQR